jgi:hypothetical protein
MAKCRAIPHPQEDFLSSDPDPPKNRVDNNRDTILEITRRGGKPNVFFAVFHVGSWIDLLFTNLLKLKSTLKLDHAASQTAFGLSEERILDLRARAIEIEWLQVQEIEDIEKVRLDLQGSSFAQEAT